MKKLFLLLFIMCFVSSLFAHEPIDIPVRIRGVTVVSRPGASRPVEYGEYDPYPMHHVGSPDTRSESPITRSLKDKPEILFGE